MKPIILLFSFLISMQIFAQKSEYRYASIRLGYNQGFSMQPGFNANKYLSTPNGEMNQVFRVDKYYSTYSGLDGLVK